MCAPNVIKKEKLSFSTEWCYAKKQNKISSVSMSVIRKSAQSLDFSKCKLMSSDQVSNTHFNIRHAVVRLKGKENVRSHIASERSCLSPAEQKSEQRLRLQLEKARTIMWRHLQYYQWNGKRHKYGVFLMFHST